MLLPSCMMHVTCRAITTKETAMMAVTGGKDSPLFFRHVDRIAGTMVQAHIDLEPNMVHC